MTTMRTKSSIYRHTILKIEYKRTQNGGYELMVDKDDHYQTKFKEG